MNKKLLKTIFDSSITGQSTYAPGWLLPFRDPLQSPGKVNWLIPFKQWYCMKQ